MTFLFICLCAWLVSAVLALALTLALALALAVILFSPYSIPSSVSGWWSADLNHCFFSPWYLMMVLLLDCQLICPWCVCCTCGYKIPVPPEMSKNNSFTSTSSLITCNTIVCLLSITWRRFDHYLPCHVASSWCCCCWTCYSIFICDRIT